VARIGFSQLPHGFHERIAELSGAQLKVWLAHRCREGKAGESYPSLDRLARDTGLHVDAIKDARKWLRANGWLLSSGQTHTARGRFSIPIERTAIPEIVGGEIPPRSASSAEAKDSSGKNPPRRSGNTPPQSGGEKPPRAAVVKTVDGENRPEVDPVSGSRPKDLEVDPKENYTQPTKQPATGLRGDVRASAKNSEEKFQQIRQA
jgi:hypothetical protein